MGQQLRCCGARLARGAAASRQRARQRLANSDRSRPVGHAQCKRQGAAQSGNPTNCTSRPRERERQCLGTLGNRTAQRQEKSRAALHWQASSKNYLARHCQGNYNSLPFISIYVAVARHCICLARCRDAVDGRCASRISSKFEPGA